VSPVGVHKKEDDLLQEACHMLVLTRKKDEIIKIDGPAVIKILEVNRHRVRLGIDAADDVQIRRGELLDGLGIEQPSATE
jgi:carbon storage regulator CsrA